MVPISSFVSTRKFQRTPLPRQHISRVVNESPSMSSVAFQTAASELGHGWLKFCIYFLRAESWFLQPSGSLGYKPVSFQSQILWRLVLFLVQFTWPGKPKCCMEPSVRRGASEAVASLLHYGLQCWESGTWPDSISTPTYLIVAFTFYLWKIFC